MANRVFCDFCNQDIWRATVFGNETILDCCSGVSFQGASIIEQAKKSGDAAIEKLIDAALLETSLTAFFILADTASRGFVTYELEKSFERGNEVAIRSTVRMTGIVKNTVVKLIVEAGAVCSPYMNAKLRNLRWQPRSGG